MKTYSRICAIVFGLMMTILCIVISLETILRKIFNHSLSGVDELSGYAIAIGAPLCFAIAAIEQSHIRINLFYSKLPKSIKSILDVCSSYTLASLSLYLTVFTFRTVEETKLFDSVAQTPWMTPLILPQSLWLIGMIIFCLASLLLAMRVTILVFKKDMESIVTEFGPDVIDKELELELTDLEARK